MDRLLKYIISVLVLAMLTGCLDGTTKGDMLDIDGVTLSPDVDPSKFVCNPFDEDSGQLGYLQGVKAELYYLTNDMPRYAAAQDYIQNGQSIQGLNLYMSHLDIPTRPFDRGFTTQSGFTITTPEGNTLYEYFALDITGHLALGSQQAAGDYQMAVLSDDGAVLQMDLGNGLETVVDNDGNHPTKMGCASKKITMSNKPIPFNLKYYQGPRMHISLVVMWRPWPANAGDENDELCDQAGNDLFFDSRLNPPKPQSAYSDLLARGWTVVGPENYMIPDLSEENPCNVPAPILLDMNMTDLTRDSVVLSWTTDIPSVSRVKYVHSVTGEEFISSDTLEYSTRHRVSLEDLESNVLYNVYLISMSVSGRVSSSQAMTVKTRR